MPFERHSNASKLSADAGQEAQEITLSAMREGKAKRLHQLELEYNARKETHLGEAP